MYTNADCTLYLYSKDGKAEKYTRMSIEGVYWEDVRQSTFLKIGQRDAMSALLVIPLESLEGPIKITQGKDLVVKGIAESTIDCSSQEAMAKSMSNLKAAHGMLTIMTVDERLYGSESMQHYELSCK
mgnify:CR=1 FL=1